MLARLEAIRSNASVAMGLAPSVEEAAGILGAPKVAFVAAPAEAPTLSGRRLGAAEADMFVRIISIGQPHPGGGANRGAVPGRRLPCSEQRAVRDGAGAGQVGTAADRAPIGARFGPCRDRLRQSGDRGSACHGVQDRAAPVHRRGVLPRAEERRGVTRDAPAQSLTRAFTDHVSEAERDPFAIGTWAGRLEGESAP